MAKNKISKNAAKIIPKKDLPPVETTESEDGKKGNPFIEVVSKRLRTLRKRITRIEKYEEMIQADSTAKSQMNPDQLQALEKKPEVVSAIKELEEMVKSLSVVEIEDRKARKQAEQDQQLEMKLAVKRSIQDNKTEMIEQLKRLTILFYVSQFQMNEQSETISPFIHNLFSSISSMNLEEVTQILNKFSDKSNDTIPSSSSSYSKLEDIIQDFLTPKPEDTQAVNTEDLDPTSNPEEGSERNLEDDIGPSQVTVPPGGIKFMSESEIIEESPEKPNVVSLAQILDMPPVTQDNPIENTSEIQPHSTSWADSEHHQMPTFDPIQDSYLATPDSTQLRDQQTWQQANFRQGFRRDNRRGSGSYPRGSPRGHSYTRGTGRENGMFRGQGHRGRGYRGNGNQYRNERTHPDSRYSASMGTV